MTPIHAKFIIAATMQAMTFCERFLIYEPICVEEVVEIAMDEGDIDRAKAIYLRDFLEEATSELQ